MKISKKYLLILLVLSSATILAEEPETSSEGILIGIKPSSEAFSSLSISDMEATPLMSTPVDISDVILEENFPSLKTLVEREFSRSLSGPECRGSVNPMGSQPLFSLMYDVNTLNMYNKARFNSSQTNCGSTFTRYIYRESRFNLSRCENIVRCQGTKLSYVEDADREKIQKMLNDLSAKEFAKNFLKAKVDSMEKLELLKKFAQKNFDSKIGQSCTSRFAATEGIQCQMSTVVEAFSDYQKTCKVTQVGCYNGPNNVNDVPSFNEFNIKFKPNSGGAFQSYFDTRTDAYARRYSNLDKAYVENLGDLVTNEIFNSSTDEEKEAMFINALKETGTRDGIYVDPVLNADFNLAFKDNKSIKENDQYKNLKAIFLDKNITKSEFVSKFNNYRKSRSESLLKDSCAKVPTTENLCKSTTSLKLGVRSPVDIDNVSMANIMIDKSYDKDSAEYKKIKDMTGGLWDESDFEAMLDAKKCYTFGYADNSYRFDLRNALINGNRGDRETDFNSMGSTDGGKRGSRSGSKSEGDMDDETLRSMGLGKSSVAREEISTTNDEPSSSSVERSNPFTQQHYPTEDAYTNNYFNPNAFNATSHYVDKDNGRGEEVVDQKHTEVTKSESESSNVSDSRIAELIKKLAATEDRLDKLKASTEAADEARAKEKKIAEENALIAELKGQISELKNKNAIKPVAAQTSVAERQEEMRIAPQSSNFSISSRNNSDFRDGGHASDVADKRKSQADNGSSSSGQSAPTSQAGRSIASAPQLTASSSDNGNDQGTGLVLTRVDGMTSEKAIETIANKIIELNGVPFLIEEDGVTKKVIPLIRNGKIELDENGQPKFVKIKVNRKECTEEEKTNGKCRAPASVAAKTNDSVADEKRDQEQRIRREIERAQYLKLKALTNKAMTKPAANKKP